MRASEDGMKYLMRLVIASLVAIALIEARRYVVAGQPGLPRRIANAHPHLPRESRLYKIRRKAVLRVERLVAPIVERAGLRDRSRWR